MYMSESYDICMVRCDARNAGRRKTNRATRYVGPYIFAHAFNDVTYMINEYNVHIADACYYIAAHALPDAHCVIAL